MGTRTCRIRSIGFGDVALASAASNTNDVTVLPTVTLFDRRAAPKAPTLAGIPA